MAFTYLDRESNERGLGSCDRETGRFTALTQDGRRITTHFRPSAADILVQDTSEFPTDSEYNKARRELRPGRKYGFKPICAKTRQPRA